MYLLEDLWECLEGASGKPIAAVMNTWTKQMGFPLIYVEAEQVNLIKSPSICLILSEIQSMVSNLFLCTLRILGDI